MQFVRWLLLLSLLLCASATSAWAKGERLPPTAAVMPRQQITPAALLARFPTSIPLRKDLGVVPWLGEKMAGAALAVRF